jgi:hypothetical protein
LSVEQHPFDVCRRFRGHREWQVAHSNTVPNPICFRKQTVRSMIRQPVGEPSLASVVRLGFGDIDGPDRVSPAMTLAPTSECGRTAYPFPRIASNA